MVVLGVPGQRFGGALFVGGFLPAAVIALMLMALIYVQAVRGELPREPRPTRGSPPHLRPGAGSADHARDPVRGILGGITTPTEAAGCAVVYAILVGVVIYGRSRSGTCPSSSPTPP